MLSAIDIHTAPFSVLATGWAVAGYRMPAFAQKTGNGGRFALASRCVS